MRVKVNGIELYYETEGEGRALVMMHGNREDHTIFDKASEVLKTGFKLYLVDSRCHGESEDTEDLTYNLLSDDIIAFVEELGIEKPILFGFSDGGIAALYAAAKRPDLFSAVIAAGANSHPKGLKRYVYRGIRLKILYSRDKYDYLMINGPHLKASDLAKIKCPSLILAADNDVVKRKDTEFIASSIPSSRLVILDHEDHGSYIVHSERIGEIIKSNLDFLT